MNKTLSPTERAKALQQLGNWALDENSKAMTRVFKFASFSEAFGFMTRIAMAADKADHHPDWSNSYASVSITLSSHDEGGITAKDIALAQVIDEIFG